MEPSALSYGTVLLLSDFRIWSRRGKLPNSLGREISTCRKVRKVCYHPHASIILCLNLSGVRFHFKTTLLEEAASSMQGRGAFPVALGELALA